jgi:hypothetical protein
MPRAICRCGEPLTVPMNGAPSERVVCPGCGARVRVRRGTGAGAAADATEVDGYLRFFCPCGKRLKVPAVNPPTHGKCPDCGSVVPVPKAGLGASGLPPGHPETPTTELSPGDLAELERWSHDHLARAARAVEDPQTQILRTPTPAESAPPEPPPASDLPRAEVGLRLCPNCRRPVHLGRDVCQCGTPVPRR